MKMQIVPFEAGMVDEAAALLVGQQARYLELFPELPARYTAAEGALEALKSLGQKKRLDGFAAVQGHRLAAYLLGERLLESPIWGRAGWVHPPGCAYDPAVGVETVRDLYAALGDLWVSQGIFTHIVMAFPTDPDLMQAWFSLSFGIEQMHGLLNLEALQPAYPQLPADVVIRRVEAGDGPILADLSDQIWKFQTQAPVWGMMLPEFVSETADGWADLAEDPEAAVWLAFLEGQPVGMQGYWAADENNINLYIPPSCVYLSVAATKPEVRGKGIGTLLTQTGLAWAYQAGFQFCETDWRSTNLLSSRFWPRRGFRPVIYRLARRIDQRIAWAAR